ncbi:hypothetical protein, conserved [Plasmodium gonderi]|uniref:Uncharacterized protein n=1 Tax=Plasmodium gonderi TaxID=77519 RepID=A0A1Y1JEP5_PLAGO|nr:hypothetical protein, conserved [Plasmodium gonderi]GAW79815.1 hypothetical protein, conserved [Plasmodium gonderi]
MKTWDIFIKSQGIRLCGTKYDIPDFFIKGPKLGSIKMNNLWERSNEEVLNNSKKNTPISCHQYGKDGDFYERLIRIYVDIIFNSGKYPAHVQHLHIFCRELLKDKVLNLKSSKNHKRILLKCEECGNPETENLNEYLVHLNDEALKNKKLTENEQNKIFETVKKIYNYKNVLYVLFTLEHNRIMFNYSEHLFLKHIQNCFLNSAVSSRMDIYRYIKRFGADNVCIYICEYSNHADILKKRHEIVKNLFFNYKQNGKISFRT